MPDNNRCREESHLFGNQGICAGAYRTQGQQLVYRSGEAEMRYHRARKLQQTEVR